MRPDNRPDIGNLLARAAAIMAVVVVVDLLIKWAMTAWLGPHADRHNWWLAGEWLGFEYTRNTGAAFGLFPGNPELLAAIALLLTGGIVWLVLLEVRSRLWATLASGLLAGGASGNFVERVAVGYVTDFVAVGPWPRFNIADSAITIGIAIFAVTVVMTSADVVDERAHPEGNARD